MTRKQMNIRLDELTREAIKGIAEKYNMSESQVVTRGILLLEQSLEKSTNVATNVARQPSRKNKTHQEAE